MLFGIKIDGNVAEDEAEDDDGSVLPPLLGMGPPAARRGPDPLWVIKGRPSSMPRGTVLCSLRQAREESAQASSHLP